MTASGAFRESVNTKVGPLLRHLVTAHSIFSGDPLLPYRRYRIDEEVYKKLTHGWPQLKMGNKRVVNVLGAYFFTLHIQRMKRADRICANVEMANPYTPPPTTDAPDNWNTGRPNGRTKKDNKARQAILARAKRLGLYTETLSFLGRSDGEESCHMIKIDGREFSVPSRVRLDVTKETAKMKGHSEQQLIIYYMELKKTTVKGRSEMQWKQQRKRFSRRQFSKTKDPVARMVSAGAEWCRANIDPSTGRLAQQQVKPDGAETDPPSTGSEPAQHAGREHPLPPPTPPHSYDEEDDLLADTPPRPPPSPARPKARTKSAAAISSAPAAVKAASSRPKQPPPKGPKNPKLKGKTPPPPLPVGTAIPKPKPKAAGPPAHDPPKRNWKDLTIEGETFRVQIGTTASKSKTKNPENIIIIQYFMLVDGKPGEKKLKSRTFRETVEGSVREAVKAATEWYEENIDIESRVLRSSITSGNVAPPRRPTGRPTTSTTSTREVYIDAIGESVTLLKYVGWCSGYRDAAGNVKTHEAFRISYRKREPGGTIVGSGKNLNTREFGRTRRQQIRGAADAANEFRRKWVDEEGMLRPGAP